MNDEEEKRFLEQALWEWAPTASELAKTLPKIPALSRHPVRCGRSNCRCTRGELHDSWRLVWRGIDGRQRYRYVRKHEVEAVRTILDERRAERERSRWILEVTTGRLREVERWLRELEQTNHS